MSARKKGNNKRQPRVTASGVNSQCISYNMHNPDEAKFFTPKKREKQMQIQIQNGKAVVVKRDRSLI